MADPTAGDDEKPRRMTPMEREQERAERRAKAMAMRVAGATYDQIAQQCGYSDRGAAHRAVTSELKAIPKAAGDELREIEVSVLNQVRSSYWKAMRQGDATAAGIVLGTHDRMVKLLGLETTVVDDTAQSVKDALVGFMSDITKLDLGDSDRLGNTIPSGVRDPAAGVGDEHVDDDL